MSAPALRLPLASTAVARPSWFRHGCKSKSVQQSTSAAVAASRTGEARGEAEEGEKGPAADGASAGAEAGLGARVCQPRGRLLPRPLLARDTTAAVRIVPRCWPEIPPLCFPLDLVCFSMLF